MCKHVHAVAVFREGKKQKVKPEISVTELETHMGNLCGESGPAAETPDPLEAAKQRLMSLLSEMTGEAARCQSLETVKAVTTGVLKMKALFTVGKQSQEELVSPCPTSSREPANKKC